jgi:hypothetical protein
MVTGRPEVLRAEGAAPSLGPDGSPDPAAGRISLVDAGKAQIRDPDDRGSTEHGVTGQVALEPRAFDVPEQRIVLGALIAVEELFLHRRELSRPEVGGQPATGGCRGQRPQVFGRGLVGLLGAVDRAKELEVLLSVPSRVARHDPTGCKEQTTRYTW